MLGQRIRRHVLLAMLGALAAVSGAAFANHIDFLDDPTFVVSDTEGAGPTSQTQTGLLTGNTLGGQRDISIEAVTELVSAELMDTNPGVVGDVDYLAFLAATQVSQGTLLVQIGQGGDLNANFLDIPMSIFDWDRVRLDFGLPGLASSAASMVTVTLFSRENGGTVSVSKPFGGGNANVDFLHSEFGVTSDFLRNVDQASFFVSGVAGGDYYIESFNRNGRVDPNAVSEPASSLLLAAALLAFGLRRRRS